jgi:mannose-6-phosphate isomerase-like protein (cupin superfamily)
VPELIESPVLIPVPGGKQIAEYVGRVRTNDSAASLAHMVAPAGWSEPAQTPDFDEMTLVLKGVVRVESGGAVIDVPAGQAIITRAGETIRYSVPLESETGFDTTEYVAVCLPAFAPELAHRADE